MRIERPSFIIESDKEISYIDEVISTLEEHTYDILNFFKLEKLSQKKRVIIYTNREKYKEHLLPYVKEFKDWMQADTYDGNINLLEISESRKSEAHKDLTLEEFTKCILHEFVHASQQEINSNSKGVAWYWEALATNLSGQNYSIVDLSKCDFNKLQDDFNNTDYAYSYAYTIGRFMLDNYSQEQLLEYVKYPKKLKEDASKIFLAARQSQSKNTK